MRIQLYLQNRIVNFILPNEISGSFSFDEKIDEDAKLINIEAKDDSWFLYSTDYVKVIMDGHIVKEAKIVPNSFYLIRRGKKEFLIYISNLFDETITTYTYRDNVNVLINNQEDASIRYMCEYLGNTNVSIKIVNNQLVLETNDNKFVYINDHIINGTKYYIKFGDQLDLCGLKLMFLNGLLFINNPGKKVMVNTTKSNLTSYSFPKEDEPESIEFKDEKLYSEEQYFSKSPRIRRVIEKKEIEFSQPPSSNKEKDLPAILTIGPMLTMGVMSVVMLIDVLSKIIAGETTFKENWAQIVMAGSMLISMLLWPVIIDAYNKKFKEKNRKELIKKYGEYLKKKEVELQEETKLQREILIENLITVEECNKIIKDRDSKFWNKRIDQNDFLTVRIGMGNELLDIDVKWPEEGFSIDEDILKENATMLLTKYKYIKDVPIGYSFYKNRNTAIMGNDIKTTYFINNVLIQLLAFYSYEDLKIVVFTNEENEHKWDYIKYLNHNLSNDKAIRLFSNNIESAKSLSDYLLYVYNSREPAEKEVDLQKPYYLIITDDYSQIKRLEFIKTVTETSNDMGFSMIFIENRLKNLPSKCTDFIALGDKSSGVLENSYEKQEQKVFYDEINYTVNMMNISRITSNIPIEFEEEGEQHLPDAISFLEMEKVGRVKQLNISNRWSTNDSTQSLKSEIGIGTDGNYMYLDLHEKFHGPHGLIAGMTGSGKSEFIITWILSMCINYSPDDVSFILIDYKGGGLAFAFENQATGIRLPHLAGTITNLDKAEMDRTLVSIESEARRRQAKFNEVRDKLGESTLDIYKYQQFYKEGKINEAMPHLFIVCDEFAELKDQQPDFMDNLISIARIGRSLGVHLILATQKPSGVVNDQIWSNAKFHVCLKVQDESDSNEMIKKPDAANLKQTGRFFLQVGYDEYFALGQSAWCGAKYYPADQIIKQVDKSINFINDVGMIYKSIQANTEKRVQEEGEQLPAIMDEIIDIAKSQDKQAKRLWLENIPEVILLDNIIKKYSIKFDNNKITAIIGEYDNPGEQKQGLLNHEYLAKKNTGIYGGEGLEAEQLLDSMIFSTIKNYSSEFINFYIIDYGSQALSKYNQAPHIGDIVNMVDDEKYFNLFKMIKKEIKDRKQLFSNYGGNYINYQKNSKEKLPLLVIILNNYDAIDELDKTLFDNFPEIIRDSERYGIIFIITASGVSSIPRRVTQSMSTNYSLKLKDASDYSTILPAKNSIEPRNMVGRGIYKDGELLHEFQTASILGPDKDLTKYVIDECIKLNKSNLVKAPKVPILPDQVTIDYVKDRISDMKFVPIGIDKNSLSVVRYDFTRSIGNLVSANNLKYMKSFAGSFITTLKYIKNLNLVVLDPEKGLEYKKGKINNYYNSNFDNVVDKVKGYIDKLIDSNSNINIFVMIYGVSKTIDSLSGSSKIEDLLKSMKQYDKASMMLLDDISNLKNCSFEDWYTDYFNDNNGLFIGNGAGDQNIIKINNYQQELSDEYPNNIGFYVKEGKYRIIKVIEFEKVETGDDDE